MPSTSRRQQRFFYAEKSKKEKGQKTETGLSLKTIREFLKYEPKKKKK
jgi:hypothetical protein